MKTKFTFCVGIVLLLGFSVVLTAQTVFPPNSLDPTRNITSPQFIDQGHSPLPEQYIWTAEKPSADQAQAGDNAAFQVPRYFRTEFQVRAVPQQATLYVAGPAALDVYINGKLAGSAQADPSFPVKDPVFAMNVAGFLQAGINTVALKIMPLHPHHHDEPYLVAKIVPRGEGIDAPALMISGPEWRAALTATTGWEGSNFDASSWMPVKALGPIESSIEFYQANEDAGLYRWPGYVGASTFLAHTSLPITEVQQIYRGRSSYSNLDSLTKTSVPGTAQEFTVHLASASVPEQQVPSLLLDFGKEINGRLQIVSDSDHPIQMTIQYGESKDETIIQPYLGVDPLTVLPHATAYGPKSSFRYAKIRFVGGGQDLRFKKIALDAIYYPVQYRGSFESSDPLLNRIWEVGAYTSHLCMQDDIWDAPKRDRMRWAGDLDVSGRVIDDIFFDHFLMQDTMTRLLGDVPVKNHVNTIPGYSAWWISELTQYYLHTGSLDYVKGLHEPLLQLLNYMDTEVDAKNLFANTSKAWPFVDWSPELSSDTPEARRATQFEYYLAYRDAAYLLRQLGDSSNAAHYEQRAQLLKDASQNYLLDALTGTFGPRWQTNAIAIYSGVADPSQYPAIWDHVLSTVATTKDTALFMSPYYNYYIISAMAQTGHTVEALDWIRNYWGGMLAEGATSTWEAYYPSWPKHNFHASLQADGGTGYFVSLAHGWSSGPTAWAMEQILGIQPTGPGFTQVTIRPDLAGLKWAKGAEPTPHGLLKVELQQQHSLQIGVDVPAGVEATILAPTEHATGTRILVNGKAATDSKVIENGSRVAVVLNQPGHYTISAE